MPTGGSVYTFHVPGENAVKVGYGNPTERMDGYSRQYALCPAPKSLREWKLPTCGLARDAERECHTALRQAGLWPLRHKIGGHQAKELFSLGDNSYAAAVTIVEQTIDDFVDQVKSSIARRERAVTSTVVVKGLEQKSSKSAVTASSYLLTWLENVGMERILCQVVLARAGIKKELWEDAKFSVHLA